MRFLPNRIASRKAWFLCMAALLTLQIGMPIVAEADDAITRAEDDGYRGIWYAVGETKDEYAFKYSGGMATYPQQYAPIACYAAAANKTFFVPPWEQPWRLR